MKKINLILLIVIMACVGCSKLSSRLYAQEIKSDNQLNNLYKSKSSQFELYNDLIIFDKTGDLFLLIQTKYIDNKHHINNNALYVKTNISYVGESIDIILVTETNNHIALFSNELSELDMFWIFNINSYTISSSEMNLLKTCRIAEIILVQYNENSIHFTISENQSDYFMQIFSLYY